MRAILEVPCSIFRVAQYIWSREELGIFWWKIKRTGKRLLAPASILPFSRRGDRAPQKRARFPSLWLLGWPRAFHWEKSMAQSHTTCSTKDTSWVNDASCSGVGLWMVGFEGQCEIYLKGNTCYHGFSNCFQATQLVCQGFMVLCQTPSHVTDKATLFNWSSYHLSTIYYMWGDSLGME